jgi:hypothetical protein
LSRPAARKAPPAQGAGLDVEAEAFEQKPDDPARQQKLQEDLLDIVGAMLET